ncbi:MAG: hypothetical protein ABFS37_14325, partial [Acidobacteriota bacterium]
MSQGGVIDLSLTWDNTNDLILYLYNPSGTEVAKGISRAPPPPFMPLCAFLWLFPLVVALPFSTA